MVLWEIKVGALYKQHQLSADKYAIALTHLISIFIEWPSYVTIADADIGSLKSLHILFYDKYLDHMLVKFEKKIVWSKLYKILWFLTKHG